MTLATDILFVQQDILMYKRILASMQARGINFANSDCCKDVSYKLQLAQERLARLEQKESSDDHAPA